MNDSLVALVTGGGSGIGAAAARQLLDQGYRVTIGGRSGGAGWPRSSGTEGPPDGARDAADCVAVESAIEATLQEFGQLNARSAMSINQSSTATSFFEADEASRTAP